MQGEFARIGLSFERFPAVNGTALPDAVRPYFCDAAGRVVSPLKPGEIGCYASHLALWQRIAAGVHGDGPVLVCEDDLVLPDDLAPLLDEILARAPAGWDVIRLSSETRRRLVPVDNLQGRRMLVRFTRSPINSGAYLIARSGARKLSRPGLRRLPIDRDLSNPWAFGINELGLHPPIRQNVMPSIIVPMGGRNLDRSQIRRAADKLRRLAFNIRTLGLWRLATARAP
jgi:glycosyl transferase, family 25